MLLLLHNASFCADNIFIKRHTSPLVHVGLNVNRRQHFLLIHSAISSQAVSHIMLLLTVLSPRNDSGTDLDLLPHVLHTACPKVIYETQQETHSMDILHSRVKQCYALSMLGIQGRLVVKHTQRNTHGCFDRRVQRG